ncbi:hypothetical protein AAG906_013183 [Vitis piasezkii]
MKILRKLYPALNLPEKCADDKPYEPTYMVSQEKTKSLGIDFTPLERLVANKLCEGNVLDYTICKDTVSSAFGNVGSEVAWSINFIL